MSNVSHVVEWEKEGDVTVARFRARSVTEAQLLEQAFEDMKTLAELGYSKVVFSLGNVDAISSRAIASLVWLNRELLARKGRLKLCELDPLVAHVFAVARLDEVLDVYDTREEAIAAFGEAE